MLSFLRFFNCKMTLGFIFVFSALSVHGGELDLSSELTASGCVGLMNADAQSEQPKQSNEKSDEFDLAGQFQAIQSVAISNGIGVRRYVRSTPRGTSENMSAAAEATNNRVMWWNTHVYFFQSEEEALAHAAKLAKTVGSAFSIGLFVVSKNNPIHVTATASGTPIPKADVEKFLKDKDTKIIEYNFFDPTGQFSSEPKVRKVLDGVELLSRMDLDSHPLKYYEGDEATLGQNVVFIGGWHSGMFTGVIDLYKFFKSAKYKDTLRIAKLIRNHGYQIIVNPSDPKMLDQAVVFLKNAKRFKMVKIDGKMVAQEISVQKNRHVMAPALIDSFIADYKSGKAFLSLLIDSSGRVVGGVPGATKELTGDSTFYDPAFAEKFNLSVLITPAELAILPIFAAALESGQRYIFTGPMVTNFAWNLGAEPKPSPHAAELKKLEQEGGVRVVPPVLDDLVFDPYQVIASKSSHLPAVQAVIDVSAANLSNEFSDMFKRKIKIGRFLGSRPGISGRTVEFARSLGLEHGVLKIQIVPDEKTAKILAQQEPESVDRTLFLVYRDIDSLKNLAPDKLIRYILNRDFFPTIVEQRRGQSRYVFKSAFVLDVALDKNKSMTLRPQFFDFHALNLILNLDTFFYVRTIGWNESDHVMTLEVPGWLQSP